MKSASVVLLALGIVFLAGAAINVPKAPNGSYLIGTFLPGLFCLIIGMKLGQNKRLKPGSRADGDLAETAASDFDPTERSSQGDKKRSDAFKFRTNLGVGCGILLSGLGYAVAQATDDGLLVGLLVSFAGCAGLIWGCVNYTRWKGYSGWFGFFGYLYLPGLLVLVCLPNRRKRLLQERRPEQIGQMEKLLKEDRRPGYRFLLTLLPGGVLFIGLGGFLLWSRSNIDAAEWKQITPQGFGFQALMPGTPSLDQQTKESPAGKVELAKFTVKPKGKNELFMIVSLRFPEAVGRALGGTQKILEIGRQDVLSSSQGQLKSERQISLSGCPGLELEVVPPKGAIIKARLYATKDRLYQVSVHVPKIRLTSEDVQEFFDSFKLSANR